MLFAFLGSV